MRGAHLKTDYAVVDGCRQELRNLLDDFAVLWRVEPPVSQAVRGCLAADFAFSDYIKRSIIESMQSSQNESKRRHSPELGYSAQKIDECHDNKTL